MDFGALISRHHRPSRISRITPRSALDGDENNETTSAKTAVSATFASKSSVGKVSAGGKNKFGDEENSEHDDDDYEDDFSATSSRNRISYYYLVEADDDQYDDDADEYYDEIYHRDELVQDGDDDAILRDLTSSKDAKYKRWLQSDVEEAREAAELNHMRRAMARKEREARREMEREGMGRFARSLVERTSYYASQKRPEEEEENGRGNDVFDSGGLAAAAKLMGNWGNGYRSGNVAGFGGSSAFAIAPPVPKVQNNRLLHPSLHGIVQSDWENMIHWGDDEEDDDDEEQDDVNDGGDEYYDSNERKRRRRRQQQQMLFLQGGKNGSERRGTRVGGSTAVDPHELLNRGHNPALASMDFGSLVSWEGADAPPGYNASLAESVPLILHEGTAGASVARLAVPPRRPLPLSRSDIYIRRVEREMGANASCTAGPSLPGGGLNMNDSRLQEIIAQRQEKRRLMAIDKSKRVTDAMGTLDMGGGKGRAITSSLMGPGGTERTGRPTKHVGSSSAYDAELVEHLDLIYNHTLVRPDLKKSELRQFHRPRLPRSVVTPRLLWKLQVRRGRGGAGGVGGVGGAASANKGAKGPSADGSTIIASSSLMGTHPGAISQAKLRNEADLSAAEGMLVLFEYCEERPSVQMAKGMACKIVNFYRGDKARCPISAGGGARPPRKRPGGDKAASLNATGKPEHPNLIGPEAFDRAHVADLVGFKKKKKKKKGTTDDGDKEGDDKEKKEEEQCDFLPEGTTEILHPKMHGPFIGAVDDCTTQSGLITNLFAAPIFKHDPESSDFLLVLGKKPPNSFMKKKHHDTSGSGADAQPTTSFGVVLRPFPTSVYCVGQTEPKVKVFAPNTTGEKNFTNPFVTYQIAKALTRTETKEGRGLRFDEINDRLFANTELLPNALRQRIKQVAIYDKNTQIWTSKEIGFEDYPGVEALGRRFSPEGVAAYESACAYVRRLCDLGIADLHSGSSGVQSVGQALVYVLGAVTAARERKSKIAKMAEFAKNSTKSSSRLQQQQNQTSLYEEAASKLESDWKDLRRKQEVARFIYEELQLAPWNLTQEFIDIHKNAQGTAMMRLTGLGDPSGRGEGYNFLREMDAKPNKGTGNTDGALNAQIKKITGTENDLRKLTMKQMASLLRSYGMGQKEIDTLKRWDRVHCIRDLSTKAASDGMGDGLERYARGEKMKLSDQKQMYRDRIQEIWKRQRAALSTDAGPFETTSSRAAAAAASSSTANASAPGAEGSAASGSQTNPDGTAAAVPPGAEKKQTNPTRDMDDSDSEESDDDFAAALEEDMMDVRETNLLVADHVRGDGDDPVIGPVGGLGRRGAASGDDTQEMSKDARELAALKRQREEERLAQEGLLSKSGAAGNGNKGRGEEKKKEIVNRKVIRKRVTKTHPDGTQTTTFEFIVRAEEVDKFFAKKKEEKKKAEKPGGKFDTTGGADKKKKNKNKESMHDKPEEIVGHSMFEEDEGEHRTHKPGIKLHIQKSTRVVTKKTTKKVNHSMIRTKAPPKPAKPVKLSKRPKLQMGRGSGGGKGDGGKGGSGSGTGRSGTGSNGSGKNTSSSKAASSSQKMKDKKRKRRQQEEEAAELYSSAPHRKGTSNRRERGAARHRMPHVLMSTRLEEIRSTVERRPNSGPFHRPVDRRLIPRYYEVISEPIDLQTIRDKNQRYEYRTVDTFVRDFDLMKHNAIKFNGDGSMLGNEATAMYDYVKHIAESNRDEFAKMEEAVRNQLSNSNNGGNGRKKVKKNHNSSSSSSRGLSSQVKKGDDKKKNGGGTGGKGNNNNGGDGGSASAIDTMHNVSVDGVTATVNLGSIGNISFDSGTDSDDSTGIVVGGGGS